MRNVLPLLPAVFLAAQEPPTAVFRVSVGLVQVDAVVTDSKGRQVTDLEVQDFEIRQDGKLQKITHFSYVRTQPDALPAAPSAGPLPPARLKREQVRRTVALVVDDLGLGFSSIAYVRDALRKYIDRQMQPGDLVAVIRTSAGMGALQQFTADKRQLYAAVDRIRWTPFGRHNIGSFGPMPGGSDEAAAAEERFNEFQEEIFSVGTIGAINFVLRGLEELPGRKSVVLFSDGMRIIERDGTTGRVLDALKRLTDEANRASAVIYSIDARGLETLVPGAGQRSAPPPEAFSQTTQEHWESQDGLSYMAQQTGGLFLHDTNDISGAVGQVMQDQSGYYLIGYSPGTDTFELDRGQSRYHRISVRVKRPGLQIRSRSGFYGVPDHEVKPAARGRDAQLAAALTSPFSSGGVRLRLTALFANTAKAGSFIYALLHINARDLSFTDEPDGWHKTVLDVLVSTFGDNGVELDRTGRTYTLRVRGESYKAALDHGLVYSIHHAIKKGGAYQMRVAVRDATSERVGSANQFIEAPEMKKGRLALSGITMRQLDPALAQKMAAHGLQEGQVEDPEPEAGPALRIFRPGRAVIYAFQVFNAKVDSKTRQPAVETQIRLFRDGRQTFAGRPVSVSTTRQTDLERLVAGGLLKLGNALRPGDYTLEIVATDKLAKPKSRTAAQWIDFEVK